VSSPVPPAIDHRRRNSDPLANVIAENWSPAMLSSQVPSILSPRLYGLVWLAPYGVRPEGGRIALVARDSIVSCVAAIVSLPPMIGA
jgi:hypothetical protein